MKRSKQDESKDNITTKDSGVIDTTTYKTYKTILSRNACNITTLNTGGPYKEINCSFSGNKYVPNLPKINYEQELKRESDPIKLDMRKIMIIFKAFGINNIFIS